MLIDAAFLIVIIFAILKGWSKGLIAGIFSFFAFIAGLAAALELSKVLAVFIHGHTGYTSRWMPVISFILVFILVVLLVNLAAKIIQKTISFVMLGWVDKVGGVVFYSIIYITIFSVILFLAGKSLLITPENSASKVYEYLVPWGQKAIGDADKIIAVFKEVFILLKNFFDKTGNKFAV